MTARLLIAGTSSSVGKTTVTVALTSALRARGLRIAVFKCGPDYLDPTYHSRATGSPCHNLDGWMMGEAAVRRTFVDASKEVDVALIEGVMGLYDGVDPTSNEGSTAEIAAWLQAPTLLVTDASAMARSVAALVQGYVGFDSRVHVAGVIANRVGGQAHLDLLRRAQTSPAIVGGFPSDSEHAFPERHLGLVAADVHTLRTPELEHWARLAERWCDIDAILALARKAPPLAASSLTSEAHEPVAQCRIGIARDAAFHFYYSDNLRRLESLGAELVAWSPIEDRALPDVHGLVLGGGYPELYAAALAHNTSMREAIREKAGEGMPIYGECGGLMYLARSITTLDGASHRMLGVFDAEVMMRDRLQALGYGEVELQRACILGDAGTRFRGHQFRHSEIVGEIGEPVYNVRACPSGVVHGEGWSAGNVVGSYVHAHWASNPAVARAFVTSVERYRSRGRHAG